MFLVFYYYRFDLKFTLLCEYIFAHISDYFKNIYLSLVFIYSINLDKIKFLLKKYSSVIKYNHHKRGKFLEHLNVFILPFHFKISFQLCCFFLEIWLKFISPIEVCTTCGDHKPTGTISIYKTL